MLRHVLVPKFCELSGYTDDAVRAKIKNGVWLEGVVWIKAPDGRVLIDIEGYEAWADGNQLAELRRRESGRQRNAA